MEPPYWNYPVRQTLGAVLLQQGRAEGAIAAFEKALAETPRNGWALWGVQRGYMPPPYLRNASGTRNVLFMICL
jgi:tetratricopeptide (TPR) repeat protein